MCHAVTAFIAFGKGSSVCAWGAGPGKAVPGEVRWSHLAGAGPALQLPARLVVLTSCRGGGTRQGKGAW